MSDGLHPDPKTPARLSAEAVGFARGRRRVLDGATLALRTGELVSLLGANGAGKTTLLRILLGFLSPASGEVSLDGRPIAGIARRDFARRVAYVPQSHRPPFPYLVREVVALGRVPATGLFGRTTESDHAAAAAALDTMRIAHLAERPYTELSGGERQLAMIARAMAQDATLLVMDEPTNGLDYGHQVRLLGRLRELSESGWGILMTTHHPDQARMASTRVATLLDGRVDRDGSPDEVVDADTIRRLYGVDPTFGAAAARPIHEDA